MLAERAWVQLDKGIVGGKVGGRPVMLDVSYLRRPVPTGRTYRKMVVPGPFLWVSGDEKLSFEALPVGFRRS